jgi:hypothetical protein
VIAAHAAYAVIAAHAAYAEYAVIASYAAKPANLAPAGARRQKQFADAPVTEIYHMYPGYSTITRLKITAKP